jgi:hypothetical protein
VPFGGRKYACADPATLFLAAAIYRMFDDAGRRSSWRSNNRLKILMVWDYSDSSGPASELTSTLGSPNI